MTEQKSIASTASTAVTVIEPAVEFNLDTFPTDRFNRLIPTQTIRIPSDLVIPIVQVVQLDLERDAYKSQDVPDGNKAINRVGLRKLATAAGISFIDERRTDDGTNPDVCEVTCVAEMTLPTGQRIRAHGMKRVDLGAQRWASDNQRAKYRSFFQEHVASRAENRAIRALLSLQASYPVRELAKPFAVVSYAPNMNHPAIQARVLDNLAPAIGAGFGPEPRQLTAGEPIEPIEPVQQVPEVEDDEPPHPGGTNGTVAAAEPDWFAAAEPIARGNPKLVEGLRAKAEKSGLVGPITDPQRQALAAVLGPLGLDLIAAGLKEIFEVELDTASGKPRLALTAAQAQALIDGSRSDDFIDSWRQAFGEAAAA